MTMGKTDDTDDTDNKTSVDFFDPGRSRSFTGFMLPLIIVIERRVTWSRYHITVLISSQILQLKIQLEQTLNVVYDNQDWLYKNRLINDMDTIEAIGIKRHEIIVCQRRNNELPGPRSFPALTT